MKMNLRRVVQKGWGLVFNNIESDNTFKEYTTDREEAYLGVGSHKLKPNQIPLLKETSMI